MIFLVFPNAATLGKTHEVVNTLSRLERPWAVFSKDIELLDRFYLFNDVQPDNFGVFFRDAL